MNDELNKIKSITNENGFSESFIDRLMYQYKFQNYNNQEYAWKPNKFCKF